MSRLTYFASDTCLEEQHNPYVKLLSVNQALELGLKIELSMFGDDFDRDKPNVILHCDDMVKFEYPNIFSINKDGFYDDIGTSKRFCTGLEWNYSDDTVEVVLRYIQNHLKTASEIELWCVWLGGEDIPTHVKKTQCQIDDLTVERLKKFYVSEAGNQWLLVKS